MNTASFLPYSKEEIELIDRHVVPAIIGRSAYVPAKPERLHVGFEQFAVLKAILSTIKPEVSIEVGTFEGQTFSLIAEYSKRAISIDPDPNCKDRQAADFPNGEYLVARSDDVLPPLIERFNSERTPLEFVFIDGDHGKESVRHDINNVLKYRPVTQCVVLMHDSFNPECREGILSSDWRACEYCHFVEIDFLPGIVHLNEACRGEMWGGMAMALLLPNKREGALPVRATHQLTFNAALDSRKKQDPPAKSLMASFWNILKR